MQGSGYDWRSFQRPELRESDHKTRIAIIGSDTAGVAQALRNEAFDRLIGQSVGGVAEQPLALRVRALDSAGGVDDEDRIGTGLGDPLVAFHFTPWRGDRPTADGR